LNDADKVKIKERRDLAYSLETIFPMVIPYQVFSRLFRPSSFSFVERKMEGEMPLCETEIQSEQSAFVEVP
jgi:hypothetical protein